RILSRMTKPGGSGSGSTGGDTLVRRARTAAMAARKAALGGTVEAVSSRLSGSAARLFWPSVSLQRAMIKLAGEAGRRGTRQTDRSAAMSAAERPVAIQGRRAKARRRRPSPWVQGTRGRTQAATETAWAAWSGLAR